MNRAVAAGASISERALTVRWIVRLRWGSALAEAATVIVVAFKMMPYVEVPVCVKAVLTATWAPPPWRW